MRLCLVHTLFGGEWRVLLGNEIHRLPKGQSNFVCFFGQSIVCPAGIEHIDSAVSCHCYVNLNEAHRLWGWVRMNEVALKDLEMICGELGAFDGKKGEA